MTIETPPQPVATPPAAQPDLNALLVPLLLNALQQPTVKTGPAPEPKKAEPKVEPKKESAIWTFLAFTSFAVLVAVVIGAFAQGKIPLPQLAQATAVATPQPTQIPVFSGGSSVSNQGPASGQQVTSNVAPTAIPTPVVETQHQDVPVPPADKPIEPQVVTDQQIDTQAILAQGNGPVAVAAPTAVPTQTTLQKIAPDFAPFLPNGGADAPKPTRTADEAQKVLSQGNGPLK